MKKKLKNLILILFTVYSAFFVIGSILSPVMAHYEHYELSAQLTSIFMGSCHQQPDRSFWILGYPVALCCRCFGFYIGVCTFGILEFFDKLKINLKTYAILFLLVITDIAINFGIISEPHNTGNFPRFIVGLVMGLLFIVSISYPFKRIWKRMVNYEN